MVNDYTLAMKVQEKSHLSHDQRHLVFRDPVSKINRPIAEQW